MLHELKRLGVRLAIDAFGTGYSSLNYLSHFPIDVLKIDQSFVREITADARNATIVSAVIGMCQGLQCDVIAEGVETAEQAASLLERDCRQAQGITMASRSLSMPSPDCCAPSPRWQRLNDGARRARGKR